MAKTNSMTKMQLDYAQNRLNKAYQEKRCALDDKFTTKAKTLTNRQFIAGIKAGTIKPAKDEHLDREMYSQSIFDLSEHSHNGKLDTENPVYIAKAKALRDAHTRVMDEIMLGDCKQALHAIEQFARTTFNV